MSVNNAFEIVINEYQARAESESKLILELSMPEIIRRSDEFLLPIGIATATLLNILIKESKCRKLLEVGTSYGYSTLWLADATRATEGHLVTLELQATKAEHARAQVARAGLAEQVEFRVGDALATLKDLTEPFDFVLIDLWKHLYVPVFDLVYPKLAPGAIVVADNMLIPEGARADAMAYRRHVRAARHMTSVLLPVGSGIEVSRCQAD
jgi:predicted O-methyltransferase YrrM